MSKKFATSHLSWSDRFALVDHFAPSDTAICSAFSLTDDELATARQLRSSGTFTASKTLDCASYAGIFDGSTSTAPAITTMARTSHTNPVNKGGSTTHVAAPESASKRVKAPQKRGRKGDKITLALMAAPITPTPVDAFMKQYGVSLAVLRQAKRFVEKLDDDTRAKIGKVVVKQDKATKQLMIWKADDNA